MQQYAKEQYGVHNAIILPFLWNEKLSPVNEVNVIKITIPGTLKQRSRDYNYCIDLLKLLSKEITTKLEIHLLGQTITEEAKKIIRQFKAIENSVLQVVTYEGTIDQHLYDEVLVTSDLLLLPLQIKWQFGVVEEVGGLTCLSGNIGDMVRFAVPAVMPSHYPLSKELEPLVWRISMKNVEQDVLILKKILEEKTFNKIKVNTSDIINSINNRYSITSQN